MGAAGGDEYRAAFLGIRPRVAPSRRYRGWEERRLPANGRSCARRGDAVRPVSTHGGLAVEVRALQRELQAFDVGAGGEASDAVLALVRAARRMSRLARELATAPDHVGAARDEVSLARVTDACLAGDGVGIEPGDIQAAIALVAKRAVPAGPGAAPGQTGRVQRTLDAIADLPRGGRG